MKRWRTLPEAAVQDLLLRGARAEEGGRGAGDVLRLVGGHVLLDERRRACMVKRKAAFRGGWLEHLRLWLGAQWAGLSLGMPSCPEPPGAHWRRRSRAGALPRGHFDHAAAPSPPLVRVRVRVRARARVRVRVRVRVMVRIRARARVRARVRLG